MEQEFREVHTLRTEEYNSHKEETYLFKIQRRTLRYQLWACPLNSQQSRVALEAHFLNLSVRALHHDAYQFPVQLCFISFLCTRWLLSPPSETFSFRVSVEILIAHLILICWHLSRNLEVYLLTLIILNITHLLLAVWSLNLRLLRVDDDFDALVLRFDFGGLDGSLFLPRRAYRRIIVGDVQLD